MRFTITGDLGHYNTNWAVMSYDHVAPFILGMVVASVIGFTLSHLFVPYRNRGGITTMKVSASNSTSF